MRRCWQISFIFFNYFFHTFFINKANFRWNEVEANVSMTVFWKSIIQVRNKVIQDRKVEIQFVVLSDLSMAHWLVVVDEQRIVAWWQ